MSCDSSSSSWPSISSSATPKEGEGSAPASTKLLLTVDDVIQEIGFGRFQFLIVLVSFACCFCGGVSLSVAAVFVPTLQCEWKLSDTEVAIIPLVYYIGAVVSSIILAFIGDRIGRKKVLFISFLLLVVFGVLAGIPVSDQRAIGYPWLLACQFVLGGAFSAGGLWFVYICEFLPVKMRGATPFAAQIFFGLGNSVCALEGLLLIGTVGWQWYSAIAVAIPALVSLVFLIFVPETPRYLFMSGQKKEAQALLIKMATVNRRDIVNCIAVSTEPDLKDPLYMHEQSEVSLEEEYLQNRMSVITELELKKEFVEKEKKVSPRRKLLHLLKEFRSIFSKNLRRSTFVLFYLWFSAAFVFAGGIWLPTTLLQDDGSIKFCGLGNDTRLHNSSLDITLNSTNTLHNSSDSHSTCATVTDNGFFLKIAWTAIADIPGVIASAVLIEVVGRRMNIALNSFGAALSIAPLFYCGLVEFLDGYVVTSLLFLFRCFQIGAYMTLFVYTSEVYPTRLRGTAFGVFGMDGYTGRLSSTFSALALFNFNYNAGVGLYAGLSLLSTVAALLLPIETKGKPLKDH